MATRKTKRFENHWQIWPEYDKEYNAITIDFGAYNLIDNDDEDEQHIRCIYRGLRNHLRTFIHTNLSNEVKKEFILLVNENNYITPGKKYGVEMDLTAVLSNEYKKDDLWPMIELIGEEISNEATKYLLSRGVQTIAKIKR